MIMDLVLSTYYVVSTYVQLDHPNHVDRWVYIALLRSGVSELEYLGWNLGSVTLYNNLIWFPTSMSRQCCSSFPGEETDTKKVYVIGQICTVFQSQWWNQTPVWV